MKRAPDASSISDFNTFIWVKVMQTEQVTILTIQGFFVCVFWMKHAPDAGSVIDFNPSFVSGNDLILVPRH